MTTITETIGRGALLGVASNYQSVAEALMELVDNPFDKRRGRYLTIELAIDKKGDRIVITDKGGEGMNDAGLQEWIRWGEGQEHEITDIGQYRVGGKLAAVYLANGLEIISRKSGETTLWKFRDPEWGSRTEALCSLPLIELGETYLNGKNNVSKSTRGLTQITLTGLKGHRYEVGILREKLSDTYRSLIEENRCKILVDGEILKARKIPWSAKPSVVEIPLTKVCRNVQVVGKVGAIDRDRIPNGRGIRIPAGIRTEFNGRKISDGEEFGHKLSGKGNLQRLYGEIRMQGNGLKPNQLKNGWPHDSNEWAAVEQLVSQKMQPIVSYLSSLSESRPASREEKKRANNALRRLESAFRQLRDLGHHRGSGGAGGDIGPGGRKPPKPKGKERPRTKQGGKRSSTRNPTPPPQGAVGILMRRISNMPGVLVDKLGEYTPRTQWRDMENGQRAIVINKDFPLYKSLGSSEDYLFESLAMHLVYEDATSVGEAQELVDQLIWMDKAQRETV